MLGLREGATETAAVTTGLLSDLVTRGLPTDRTLLFVIDGAPGLRRAITDVFGSRSVVQRCQVHKHRNVIGHLPERLHAYVGKALRDAWDLDSANRAARALERLAGSLERDHPGAAASIREGLDETLTVQRLGLNRRVAANAAHDEHHREPERQRRALRAQRQAVARRPDGSNAGWRALWWRRNRASGEPAATAIYVTWSAPWTHWPRPTAWLLTWRNMDDS